MTPAPVTRAAIEAALALHAAGAAYKAVIERLLLDVDEDRADAAMMMLKESRGTWALLLSSAPGRALFVGNALSGTVTALASLGWSVVSGDADRRRLRFAAARDAAVSPGHVRHVQLTGVRLPFARAAFDLVVQEGGRPELTEELARVARDERVLVARNRLAYKRSKGRRGDFYKPGPLAWLLAALRPRAGERTLRGYRDLLGGDTRAYALYPDANEFSHVVSLDAARPGLTMGPKERKNQVKVIAKRVGLFPVLTPSFAVLSAPRGPSRIGRVLDALGEHLDEPPGELDVLIATRSNTALALTGRADEPGGWALHMPLSPNKKRQVEVHARSLRELPARFPTLPVPEFLFEGKLDGVYVAAERRLGGQNAPQITGDMAATRAMFEDTVGVLAALTVGGPAELTAEEFDRLVGQRIERARDLCGRKETARAITERLGSLRAALVGRVMSRVVYHADLRAKHVQVSPQGRVLGLLDWGTCEELFLPYVDLLHLVLHQRKQESDALPVSAWRALLDDALADHERAALNDYARQLDLDPDVRRAIEEAYPLLVAGMAERNWDYSRPRWLHRQYAI